jgi:hypothetical protein
MPEISAELELAVGEVRSVELPGLGTAGCVWDHEVVGARDGRAMDEGHTVTLTTTSRRGERARSSYDSCPAAGNRRTAIVSAPSVGAAQPRA